jgi:hypothetical protein
LVGSELLELRSEEGGLDTGVATVQEKKVRDVVGLDLRGLFSVPG